MFHVLQGYTKVNSLISLFFEDYKVINLFFFWTYARTTLILSFLISSYPATTLIQEGCFQQLFLGQYAIALIIYLVLDFCYLFYKF